MALNGTYLETCRGKIESLTTKGYSIDESKTISIRSLWGVDFPMILTYMMRDECVSSAAHQH